MKRREPRRILGVDPGYGRLGWAVVSVEGSTVRRIDSGCITTSSRAAVPTRLHEIHQRLEALVVSCAPTELALEKLFFQKNTTTAIGVGEARGIVLLIAGRHALTYHEYTPSDIKLATTGYGRADKKQVEQMVRALLGLKNKLQFDDEADALAIALCAANHRPTYAT